MWCRFNSARRRANEFMRIFVPARIVQAQVYVQSRCLLKERVRAIAIAVSQAEEMEARQTVFPKGQPRKTDSQEEELPMTDPRHKSRILKRKLRRRWIHMELEGQRNGMRTKSIPRLRRKRHSPQSPGSRAQ